MSIEEQKRIKRRYKAQFMSKRWKEQKRENFRHFMERFPAKSHYLWKRGIAAFVIVAVIAVATILARHQGSASKVEAEEELSAAQVVTNYVGNPTATVVTCGAVKLTPKYNFVPDDSTQGFANINSQFGVLIDLDENRVVASKDPQTKMYPASMTKVLTVLVAAEHITPEQLDDVCTVTFDTTNYSYVNECSVVGFEVNEQVKVRDLFYGTILCSGADASLTLAEYVAGTHENFVVMMNEKLKELGISETSHFTNCVGLFDENHYTTAHDMAVIMAAALDNELCAEVLKTREYNIDPNTFHPEGQWLYDKFIGWIEDQEINGTIIGAKTGYVQESGNCCVSALRSTGGHRYICVTGKAESSLMERLDHVAIYQTYTK
ncbi:MAG: serine hydrolase [Lachnospiraceae bacterium]|nr:serine hydrolase [Lachnospiraceae bacterium]